LTWLLWVALALGLLAVVAVGLSAYGAKRWADSTLMLTRGLEGGSVTPVPLRRVVRWEAVDNRSANATLVDGPLTLTLLFRVNDAGLIDSFRAEARGGMVGKEMVMAPWEGNWSNYQTRDGMTVPFTGEVAWMRPEGRRPYFVGTVTSLSYEYSP
jgi:hypothetical protein